MLRSVHLDSVRSNDLTQPIRDGLIPCGGAQRVKLRTSCRSLDDSGDEMTASPGEAVV
jgi:hypothetical protein